MKNVIVIKLEVRYYLIIDDVVYYLLDLDGNLFLWLFVLIYLCFGVFKWYYDLGYYGVDCIYVIIR